MMFTTERDVHSLHLLFVYEYNVSVPTVHNRESSMPRDARKARTSARAGMEGIAPRVWTQSAEAAAANCKQHASDHVPDMVATAKAAR